MIMWPLQIFFAVNYRQWSHSLELKVVPCVHATSGSCCVTQPVPVYRPIFEHDIDILNSEPSKNSFAR